jgi:hypothetical protein
MGRIALAEVSAVWNPPFFADDPHVVYSASSLFRPRRFALVASGGVFLLKDTS